MTDGPGLRRDTLTVRLWTQGGAFVSVFLGVLSFKAGKPYSGQEAASDG
jgi:hypothetical protein